jgi:hypothetical protein
MPCAWETGPSYSGVIFFVAKGIAPNGEGEARRAAAPGAEALGHRQDEAPLLCLIPSPTLPFSRRLASLAVRRREGSDFLPLLLDIAAAISGEGGRGDEASRWRFRKIGPGDKATRAAPRRLSWLATTGLQALKRSLRTAPLPHPIQPRHAKVGLLAQLATRPSLQTMRGYSVSFSSSAAS